MRDVRRLWDARQGRKKREESSVTVQGVAMQNLGHRLAGMPHSPGGWRSYALTVQNGTELIALEYRCVRCLFCNTGKERQVVRLITEKGWGRAIFPQRIKKVLKNGVWTETVCPLMPVYVFVYSDEEEEPFAEFSRLNHVIRVLTYGDGSDVLTGRDLEFAAWIWGLNGRIAVMKAAQIGDRIEIIDGVFKQLHGTITRMDRRRKTIRVSVEMEGTPKQIWLAYEIVEKRAEETRDSQSKLDGWRFVPR